MGKKTDINVLIIGHSEHGKSEVAKLLCKHFGWTEGESSYVCKEIVCAELIKYGYSYSSPQEAWEDRRNNKQVWKDIIKDYNKDDLAKLIKKIFTDNELYVGLRDGEEFVTGFMDGQFDLIIFLDAMNRKPDYDPKNLDIPIGMSDVVIDNNGTKDDLYKQVDELVDYIELYVELKNQGKKIGREGGFYKVWDRLKYTGFILNSPSHEQLVDADNWLGDTLDSLLK